MYGLCEREEVRKILISKIVKLLFEFGAHRILHKKKGMNTNRLIK